MNSLTLVTGSDHKLAEWKRLFPSDRQLRAQKLDLTEIQSLDTKEIITDKVRRAYEIIKQPVLVEDVSAGLNSLGGLPGPFIKFFEQQLGPSALFQLGGAGGLATITCTIGYYDGQRLLIGHGEIQGMVVAARSGAGFGFDSVFIPNGQAKTFSEMPPEEKDHISHRHIAIEDLLRQLKQLENK